MRLDAGAPPPLPDAQGLRLALVVSRFNADVTGRLRAGAEAAFEAAGGSRADLQVIHVPGAFELAFGARAVAAAGRVHAIVCLGCVVRGETPHFEYICSAAAHGILTASLQTGVPMAFGVITANTVEEADARSQPGPSNKGWEATAAAIEMARLAQRVGARPGGTPAWLA